MTDRITSYKPNHDNITATVIDGEAVIVNLTSGVYYSMDGTGGAVWEMIEQGGSLEEMATALAARCEVSREQVLSDLAPVVAKLLEEGLVVAAEQASPSATATSQPSPDGAKTAYAPPALNIYRDMQDLLALDPPMPGLRDIPSSQNDDTPKP